MREKEKKGACSVQLESLWLVNRRLLGGCGMWASPNFCQQPEVWVEWDWTFNIAFPFFILTIEVVSPLSLPTMLPLLALFSRLPHIVNMITATNAGTTSITNHPTVIISTSTPTTSSQTAQSCTATYYNPRGENIITPLHQQPPKLTPRCLPSRSAISLPNTVLTHKISYKNPFLGGTCHVLNSPT